MKMQYETELYHHGIRGQKWGVRRFQNPDVQKVFEQLHRIDNSEKRLRTEYRRYVKRHPNSKMDLREFKKHLYMY